MNRPMFGDVVDPSVKVGSQKWYSVPLSVTAHIVAVAAIVIAPLMATDVLPTPYKTSLYTLVTAVPTPPPPPAHKVETRKVLEVNTNIPPTEAPREITPEPPVLNDIPSDTGVPNFIPGVDNPPVFEPPPTLPPAPVKPIVVGGNVKAPMKVRDVRPVYPPIAQSARVQGVVIIEATIGPDGRVMDARILRSIPLLDEAALVAVRQWEFTPTLLNYQPVPVVMTVTVNFSLQ